MPMALLLALILLRALVSSIVPSTPRWLALLHRRRAHFEAQHSFDAAKLAAAAQRGDAQRSHARMILDAVAAAACAVPTALWERRGRKPEVPSWRATGRTEADEREAAASDAEAFARSGADAEAAAPQGGCRMVMHRLGVVLGMVGLVLAELIA